MSAETDEALIDHVAERLYWHRFSDPRLKRTDGWRDCKLKEPSFAACYLESAAVAVKALREYRAN